MRKTFSIKSLIENINEFNAESADQYKAEREAKSALLESILMDADAYRGYGYLSASKIRNDAMSVGIREQREDGSWNFDNTDHTRVYYFMAEGL